MCVFLTLCRKDFKTLVQVILGVHILKLGSVKQRTGLRWKRQDRSKRSEPGWNCLGPLESHSGQSELAGLCGLRKPVTEAKRGPLETDSGVSPGTAVPVAESLVETFRA